MFRKDKKSLKGDSTFSDGFSGAPARQEKKIISTFVPSGEDTKSQEVQRNVDNFRRSEGYHPFTPRQVGLSGGQGALAMGDAVTEKPKSKKSHHLRNRVLALVVVLIILGIAAILVKQHHS